jgi:precorrin-8X/cobalt-precorrin-8 methylmutase
MHAEIYPSLYKIPRIPGRCLNEMQVRTLGLHFEELDSRDELANLFVGECDLTIEEQQAVISEEGWILGVPLGGVEFLGNDIE